MCGCSNCKYCKCYRGDYWTPDDYECVSTNDDITDEVIDRVWTNGEEWNCNDEPICPGWEEAPTEEDDYWDRYAYEEGKRYDSE